MEFNFNEFMENQNQINTSLTLSNKNIGNAIQTLKEKGIEVLSQQVDELKDNYKKIENSLNLLKMENKEIKEDSDITKTELSKIKDKTDTLEFDDSSNFSALKKKAQSRIINIVGDKSSPKYILFFRPYLTNLYSSITNSLCGGKRLGKIKTDDFNTALTLASRWTPDRKLTTRIIQECIKTQDKGLITDVKSRALDLFLEETGGII